MRGNYEKCGNPNRLRITIIMKFKKKKNKLFDKIKNKVNVTYNVEFCFIWTLTSSLLIGLPEYES